MKKYLVRFIRLPSIFEMEDMCNNMYNKHYRLVSTCYDDNMMYLFFELDEIERRCN